MKLTTKLAGTAALALALTACGGETAEAPASDAPAKAEKVDALQPGAYEVTATVTALDITEGDTAATSLKVDDIITSNVCVGEDGKLPAETFAEAGDDCSIDSGAYFRRSSVRQQLTCSRPGKTGPINLLVDGEFTADSFESDVSTGTFLAGPGDYNMKRTIAGKRTGDCSAEG